MKNEKISKGKLSLLALLAMIMLIAMSCALSSFGGGKTVIYADDESTVYFDPVNGVDTSTGLDALNGVKTFERAKELAESKDLSTIMLVSTWTITATENMTVDAGGLTIKRGYTDTSKTQPFTGTMISVALSNFVVSFSNITLDGGAIFTYDGEVIDEVDKDTQRNINLYGNNGISVSNSNTSSKASNDGGHLLYVGGDTIIGTGVKLNKNYMTADYSYGTAVYVDKGIKFTMNDGSSIENNIAKCYGSIYGVAVYTKGIFDMNGGEIKKNVHRGSNSFGVIHIDNEYGNTTTEFNLGSVDETGSYIGTGVISENYGGIGICTNSRGSILIKIGIYSGSIINNCFYNGMINLNTERAEAFLYGGNIKDNVVWLSSSFPQNGYIGSIYEGAFHVKGSPNLSNNTGGGYDADFGFYANNSKLVVDGQFTPIYEETRATRLAYRENYTVAVYLDSTYPRKIFVESLNNTIDVDIPNEFVMNYTNATTKTTEEIIFVQDDATNFGKDTLYLHSTQYYSITYYDKAETDYTKCRASSIKANKNYYTSGTALTLPISSETPCIDYTLLGFTATNDASDTTYITEISASDIGDKFYYANWASNTYDITLNENSGNYVSTYTEPTSYKYGTGLTLPTEKQITRTGYIFLGWTATNDASDTTYITEISKTDIGNKFYYAKWTQSGLYNTKFGSKQIFDTQQNWNSVKLNGFPFNTASTNQGRFTEELLGNGRYFMIKYSGNEKYPFALYFYEADGTPIVANSSNGLLNIGTEKVDMTSRNFSSDEAVVTKQYLNDNYGIAGLINIGKIKNCNLSELNDIGALLFISVNDYGTAIACNLAYKGNEKISFNGDILTPDNANNLRLNNNIHYFVDYNLSGGEIIEDYKNYFTVDDRLFLPNTENIVKTGYDFSGWYDNDEFSGIAVTEIAQGSMENKTFYAKWTAKDYNITYNTDGGSGIENSTYTVESETITLPIPTKTGYTFDGWYDNDEFSGSAITTIVQGSTGDKTFYAKWEIISFEIFVRTLEGQNINCIVKSTDTIYSLKEKLVEQTGIPTFAIRFIYAGKTLENDSTLEEYNIQKEATIHMVFEKFDITFIVNGEETTDQVEYGKMPTAPTNPTKANHKFVGWDSEIEAVTGDKTYTAKFIEVGTIYDIRFYQPQVWDCQRSPAFPIANKSFRISGLKTAYDENLNKVNWADGDYIKFTKVYSKVNDIPDETIRNRIIISLVSYTNCTREDISNAIVVKETLYNSDGTIKQELSSYGLIWALGDMGFLYTALNGSLSSCGGVGTYVTFKAQNSNNILVDIPNDNKPIDESDDDDNNHIINDTTDTSQAYIYFGGQVIDENKQALSGITVTLTYNGETYTFTTDSNGNFISDAIALVKDNTSYTIKITDGTHANVVYTRTIDSYGYGNDINNQNTTSNEIYIYTSPTVEENGKDFTYTITFEKLGDYGAISKDTLQVAYGSIITINGNKIVINGQEIEATANAKDLIYEYSFVKWIIGEEQADERMVITNDLTIKAEFTRTNIEYTIIFKNGDTELSKKTDYIYNGIIVVPTETPTKASTVDKDFTFIGWKLDNAGELLTTIRNVTGDATYVAQFSESVRKYTIIFIVNGEETTNQVEYGTVPTAPTNLAKASDDSYTYTFSGWDNEIVEVASNATYTAEFISKPKKISSIVDSANPEDEDKVDCEIESENGLDADSVIVLKVIKKDTISSDIVLPDNMEFLKTYNVQLLVNEVEITPNEELTIKFEKPVGLKDSDTYKIVLFENGETVEKIARVDGDYLVFKTSVLGDFAIVGETENEEAINLLWLIILLSVLIGLELIAIGALLRRNADEKNKVKSNRTYSFVGLPLMILSANFMKTQIVAIIILSAMVISLGVIIVLLAIKTYNQKQNTEIYKEENVEKLRQVIDNAKLLATTKVNISKKTIADYLENNYKDKVVVNRRENYTSTGLPLADTHYLASKKKKECFIYVYELKDNKMFLLLKIDNVFSGQIAKKHKNINLSKFPKSKDSWYSLIIDDSFDSANDLFKILDKILNSYNI